MSVLIHNERERSRFLRFAFVGAIGAIVDFGVLNLMVQLLHSPLVPAGTVSFIAAIISNFSWNRFWTYPDSRSKALPSQIIQFSLVSVMGLAIRVPILALLEPPMEELAFHLNDQIHLILDPRTVADNFTLAIAVIIVMFWNFFANRYWTYNDVD